MIPLEKEIKRSSFNLLFYTNPVWLLLNAVQAILSQTTLNGIEQSRFRLP